MKVRTMQYDSERQEAAIGRMRWSIRSMPFAIVPLCWAICTSPMKQFGVNGWIAGGFLGVIVGFYLSAVLASLFEWMMCVLVFLGDSESRKSGDQTKDSR